MRFLTLDCTCLVSYRSFGADNYCHNYSGFDESFFKKRNIPDDWTVYTNGIQILNQYL